MKTIYLSTGSNLGDRKANLFYASQYVQNEIGKLVLSSSIYKSEPWGFVSEEMFFNQVLEVETMLSPFEVLEKIQKIEKALGRIKTSQQWISRIVDIDLLFYEDLILNTELLKIPHPLLHKRKFVLFPLHEIKPGYMHPEFFKTVSELLEICEDQTNITLLN